MIAALLFVIAATLNMRSGDDGAAAVCAQLAIVFAVLRLRPGHFAQVVRREIEHQQAKRDEDTR